MADLSNANSQPAWVDPTSAIGPSPDPATVAPTPNGQMPAPDAQQTPQQAPQSGGQPQQGPQQSGQPQDQQQVTVNGQQDKLPPLESNQVTAQVAPDKKKNSFADWIHGAAETLSGGPHYTYSYDGDGNQVKTKANPSLGHLGLAIALEALSGGIAAAPAKGTNNIGQGAVAGLQAGQQQAQATTAEEDKQQQAAQQDQKIKQQAVENNLRFQQLSMQVGRQKMEDAQSLVVGDKNLKDFYDKPENQSRILLHTGSSADAYKVMAQHPGAQLLHIGAKPRTNEKGEPVHQNMHGQVVPEDTKGSYQAPDFDYEVVDPTPVTGIVDDKGNMTDPYVKEGAELGTINYAGTDGTLPKSFSVDFPQYQDNKLKIQSINATQTQLNSARQSLGMPDIDIKGDIKNDKTVLPFLNQFVGNVLHGGSNTPYSDALKAIAAEGDSGASAAGTLSKWLGGDGAADKLDAQMARTHTDNQLRANGVTDDKQAFAAQQSDDPKLQDLGNRFVKNEDQRKAQVARLESYAKVGSEEALAKFKADLQKSNFLPDAETGQSNPQIDAAIQGMTQGVLSPSVAMGGMGTKASDFKRAVNTELAKRGWPINIEALDAQDKQAKSAPILTSVASGGTLFGMNGNPGTFDRLEDKLTQLHNLGSPTANKFLNPAKYQAGQKLQAEIKSLVSDVPTEASTFVSGLSGKQTDARLEAAGEQLRTSDNPEQMLGSLHIIRQISKDRYDGVVASNPYIKYQFRNHNDPTTGKTFSQEAGTNGGSETANTPTVKGNPFGARPNEVPVKNQQGVVIGYTMPGKSGYRAISPEQQQQ